MPRSATRSRANTRSATRPRANTRSATRPRANTDAWDWQRLQALALREARRYLDPDSARDAAQEATLRAWRHSRACSGPPEPWITTIARREALRIATRRSEECLPDDFELAAEASQDWGVEQRAEVKSALAGLPRDQQQAILLRYWSDQTEAEIASELKAPIGTIKIRLHRARKKLADELGPIDRSSLAGICT